MLSQTARWCDPRIHYQMDPCLVIVDLSEEMGKHLSWVKVGDIMGNSGYVDADTNMVAASETEKLAAEKKKEEVEKIATEKKKEEVEKIAAAEKAKKIKS
ncbi:hypothetical protein Tco_0639618 [Tanacetum coccineum]